MSADPLAPLMELPGVAAASDQAREALGRAHRHRANLRRWPVTAAEAALRSARASAVLDGGGAKLDDQMDVSAMDDPVFAGALRVAQALEGGETEPGRRVAARAAAGAGAAAHAGRRRPRSTRAGWAGRVRTPTSGRGWSCSPTIVTGGSQRAGPGDRRGRARRIADPGAVRHRGRRGRARGVATGDHRDRARPARAGRAGGGLDASRRRLSRGGAQASPTERPKG